MLRTRFMELLDRHGVAYHVLPHRQPVYTVEAAAVERGAPIEEMVKSILLRDRSGRYVMACVTGDAQLDPQAVRAHLPPDWKRLTFASAEEIRAITGCEQGAIAPLGLPADVPVIFDQAIAERRRVNISSGDPMAGLELDPQDLLRLAGACLGRIVRTGGN